MGNVGRKTAQQEIEARREKIITDLFFQVTYVIVETLVDDNVLGLRSGQKWTKDFKGLGASVYSWRDVLRKWKKHYKNLHQQDWWKRIQLTDIRWDRIYESKNIEYLCKLLHGVTSRVALYSIANGYKDWRERESYRPRDFKVDKTLEDLVNSYLIKQMSPADIYEQEDVKLRCKEQYNELPAYVLRKYMSSLELRM